MLGVSWKHMLAITPLMNRLIIDVGMGLWEERNEARLNAELSRRPFCVFRAAGTP
jgi:hypothetical protein